MRVDSKAIFSDFLGAFAGSAVILPQSMGLGVVLFSIMGFDASSGALAGIIGAAILSLISGLFGATIGMLSAPNGPVTMLLVSTITIMSGSGASSDMMLLTLSAILVLTGVFQVVFSLIGGADLIKYIPYPVIVGQISAVGFLMIKSQVSFIFNPFLQIQDILTASVPITIAILTILTIIITPKISKKIPAVLAGFVVGIVVYQIIDYIYIHNAFSSWVVGVVPGVQNLNFGVNLEDLKTLDLRLVVTTALALMILASTDCLVTAIVADSQTNLRNNSKKEILAQGIAQMIIGFLGALGGGGTKGATLINLQSGGRRWSGVFSSIFFILLVLFFGFLGKYLPIAVLAGVIIFVGFGMINFNLINWLIYKKSRMDGLIALTVFIVTISVNLVSAVGIGILISMIMYFRMQIKAPIIHRVRDGFQKHSLNIRTDEQKKLLNENGSSIVMFELRGSLFFATADKLLELSEKYIKKDQYLIFNFLRVQFIDISGIILILQISSRMKKAGGELILCHMHKELGIGKKINKALEHIDKKNSIKILTFVDSDTSFEYVENKILQKHGILHNDSSKYIQLKENSLCKRMNPNSINLIEKLSTKYEIKKGEVIFSQYDEASSLFILLQGEIEIRLYVSKKEYKRLAKYNSGTFFGEISFISPGERSATAIVNSDAMLLELSHDALVDLQADDKERLLLELLFELGERMGVELRSSAQEIRRLEQV